MPQESLSPSRRISALAIVSAVLGAVGIAALSLAPLLPLSFSRGLTFMTLACLVGLVGLVGISVGIAAVVQIACAKGRVSGKGLAMAGILLSAGAFGVSVAYHLRAGATITIYPRCAQDTGVLMLALEMYLADNGGVYPPADAWCDSLSPRYVRRPDTFRCVLAPNQRCSYALSAVVGGVRADTLADQDHTVVLFESDRGWNAAGGAELLPKAPRHHGGDYYGFADGTSKWVARAEADRLRWQPVPKTDHRGR